MIVAKGFIWPQWKMQPGVVEIAWSTPDAVESVKHRCCYAAYNASESIALDTSREWRGKSGQVSVWYDLHQPTWWPESLSMTWDLEQVVLCRWDHKNLSIALIQCGDSPDERCSAWETPDRHSIECSIDQYYQSARNVKRFGPVKLENKVIKWYSEQWHDMTNIVHDDR